MEERRQEQIARNEAIFRAANEGIEETARGYAIDGLVPFLCECDDPECTDIVRLAIREYEAVRARPARFVYARSHDDDAGDDGASEVVAIEERYLLVEKQDRAAEVAEALDPRSAAGEPGERGG